MQVKQLKCRDIAKVTRGASGTIVDKYAEECNATVTFDHVIDAISRVGGEMKYLYSDEAHLIATQIPPKLNNYGDEHVSFTYSTDAKLVWDDQLRTWVFTGFAKSEQTITPPLPMTLEVLFKVCEKPNTWPYIADFGRTDSINYWLGVKQGYAQVFAGAGDGVSRNSFVADFELCTWTHVTYALDSDGSAKLYINGELKNSFSLPVETTSTSFAIGSNREIHTNSRFKGWIAFMRLYDRVLTDEEVAYNASKLLQGFTPTPLYYIIYAPPVRYPYFTRTMVRDARGSTHGTLGSTATISIDSDLDRPVLRLSGAPGVALPTSRLAGLVGKTQAISAYVKVTGGDNPAFILAESPSTGFILYPKLGMRFTWSDATSGNYTSSVSVADGSWHHVAISHEEYRIHIYVDGEHEATLAPGRNDVDTTVDAAYIGSWDGTSGGLQASVAILKIFDRPLTWWEVKQEAANPLDLHLNEPYVALCPACDAGPVRTRALSFNGFIVEGAYKGGVARFKILRHESIARRVL